MAGRPLLEASTNFKPQILLLNRHSNVVIKSWAELPQSLAGRARGWVGRLSAGPTWPGVWPPLDPCVKYTPVVMMILTFCQLYFIIP
jgi:hypothetical protein